MEKHQLRYTEVALTIITTIILITWLRHAQDFVVPFLVAIFIAILASSPVNYLIQKKVPMALSLLLVFMLFVACLVLISLLLGSQITLFASNLQGYKTQLQGMLQSTAGWFSQYGIHISKSGLMSSVDPGAVMQFAENLLASMGSIFSKSLLILITALIMLVEAKNIPQKIKNTFGKGSTSIIDALTAAVHHTRQFMAITALMSLLMGVAIGLGLAVIGLDHAVLWGVLVFLLNFIPSVGLIIAMVPALLFSLIQLGLAKTFVVFLLYFAVNAVIDFVIKPKLIGSKMGLSLLTIILSIFFWGWVLGPFGMVLSVPLTMLLMNMITALQPAKIV